MAWRHFGSHLLFHFLPTQRLNENYNENQSIELALVRLFFPRDKNNYFDEKK